MPAALEEEEEGEEIELLVRLLRSIGTSMAA